MSPCSSHFFASSTQPLRFAVQFRHLYFGLCSLWPFSLHLLSACSLWILPCSSSGSTAQLCGSQARGGFIKFGTVQSALHLEWSDLSGYGPRVPAAQTGATDPFTVAPFALWAHQHLHWAGNGVDAPDSGDSAAGWSQGLWSFQPFPTSSGGFERAHEDQRMRVRDRNGHQVWGAAWRGDNNKKEVIIIKIMMWIS